MVFNSNPSDSLWHVTAPGIPKWGHCLPEEPVLCHGSVGSTHEFTPTLEA